MAVEFLVRCQIPLDAEGVKRHSAMDMVLKPPTGKVVSLTDTKTDRPAPTTLDAG